MSEGGPSLSDDVAITALVISLFALVVGMSQFVQAILGTAEGYRRCASSVIGPWSKLRNRVFRWSEFRFETKYVIPLITLVLPHEGIFRKRPGQDQSEQVGGDDVYILDMYCETQQQGRRSLREGLLQRHPIGDILRASLHLPELKRHDSVSRPHAAQRASIDSEHLPADTLVLADSIEKSIQAKNVFQSMLPGATKRKGPRNSLPVTWIRLLRDLHMLYLSYYRGSLVCADDGVLSMVREHLAGEALFSDWKMRNMMRTRVAIIPIEETWDFMPPDVARPLAQSTIGVILVLAIRLGMQWRTLNRASSQLYADGNGYSLSSTDVKGLGIVLKFSVFGDSEHNSAIIPSRAVDKLMCGIVPGDPELVDDRFELIDRDRKLIHLWQPEGIYSRLGLDEASSKKLQLQNRWTTHNEVVTLLCCFLSLPGSHASAFYFPGWRSRQYSIFHFFEPRLALKDTVAKALEQRPASVGLKEAKRILDVLSSEYAYQFYDSYVKPGTGSITEAFTGWEYRVRDTISEYFQKHGYHKRNGTDKTWYMQLVAAHARLSAWANEDFDPSQPLSQVEILKRRQKLLADNDIETTYFAEHLYNQTERYIALVDHEQHGVVQYMQERSFSGTEDEIVGAWWMLMVRGIVWDMTCRCLPYPGEPVPSSYYYDETSVWFT